MKTTASIVTIVTLFALTGLVISFSENTVSGMGAKRLYIVGPDHAKAAELCAKRIDCKKSLVPVTAQAVAYDDENNLVTCACPNGGRTYQLSTLVFTPSRL